MEPAIWIEPEDVSRRLSAFDLTVQDLQEAVRRGQLARDLCTKNHPPGYRGMAAWGEGNAGLRDRLLPLKWTRSNKLNVPRTVSPDKTMSLTVIAGDKDTGDPLVQTPQPKRPRRAASRQLVINNVQPSLPGFEEDEDPDAKAKLWYLLFHRKGEAVKCELSLPTAVDGNGVIEAYLERIILPDLDVQGPPPDSNEDQGPDLDVRVQRRVG